jgi:hypothetical protein
MKQTIVQQQLSKFLLPEIWKSKEKPTKFVEYLICMSNNKSFAAFFITALYCCCMMVCMP